MIFAATLLLPLAVIATEEEPALEPRHPRAGHALESRWAASTSSTSRKKLTRKEEAEGLEQRAGAGSPSSGSPSAARSATKEIGPPVCVLFEGWDASGKGGAIKRLVVAARPPPRPGRPVRGADPRREAPPLPLALLADAAGLGRDGRVRPLLVRAGAGRAGRGLRRRARQWMRAYDEINDFERTLADEGMILIKLWMHISDEEQLKRFKRREKDPLKQWKLTDEDWRNREKRPDYEEAVEDMLARTDQEPHARWHVIEGIEVRAGEGDETRPTSRRAGARLDRPSARSSIRDAPEAARAIEPPPPTMSSAPPERDEDPVAQAVALVHVDDRRGRRLGRSIIR